MLNLDDLRHRLAASPFEAFAIQLSDGRRLAVPHPDFIAVGRGRVVVLDEHDVSHVVDPLHIVSVESPLQAA